MNTDDRLNLRARQILDDPTLPPSQRIANPGAVLKQLAQNVQGDPATLASMLAEITDATIASDMAAAILAVTL